MRPVFEPVFNIPAPTIRFWLGANKYCVYNYENGWGDLVVFGDDSLTGIIIARSFLISSLRFICV